MSRGVKIVTEMKEEEVVLLKDVDVKFVSLVRHGANQSPFRVIKSDGGKDMPKVIQAIILPNGVTLSSLAEKEGLAWLNEVKQDKVEKFDEYQKLEQIPEGDFEDGSLQMVKIHESGTFVTVGVTKDQATIKNALTLGESKEKQLDIPINPMNEPIASREGPSFVLTFRDMFEKELSSFLDVVRGAMSQSQSDTKKRKASVMNALDSFRSFLAVGLDELAKAGKGGKAKKEDELEIEKVVEKILAAINQEKQGGSDMFKTMDEFAEAVNKILDEREKNANPDPDADKDKDLDTADKDKDMADADKDVNVADKDKDSDTVDKDDKTTVQKIDAMSKRIEELESQLIADPAGGDPDDDDSSSGEDDSKKSPFAGMFTTGHAQGGLNRYMS